MLLMHVDMSLSLHYLSWLEWIISSSCFCSPTVWSYICWCPVWTHPCPHDFPCPDSVFCPLCDGLWPAPTFTALLLQCIPVNVSFDLLYVDAVSYDASTPVLIGGILQLMSRPIDCVIHILHAIIRLPAIAFRILHKVTTLQRNNLFHVLCAKPFDLFLCIACMPLHCPPLVSHFTLLCIFWCTMFRHDFFLWLSFIFICPRTLSSRLAKLLSTSNSHQLCMCVLSLFRCDLPRSLLLPWLLIYLISFVPIGRPPFVFSIPCCITQPSWHSTWSCQTCQLKHLMITDLGVEMYLWVEIASIPFPFQH